MDLIPIPEIPSEYCSRIAIRGGITLSETELHDLLKALGSDDRDKHGWLFRAQGPDAQNHSDLINESFGVDTPSGVRLERLIEAFGETPTGETPASYLHYRINIEHAVVIDAAELTGDDSLMGRFWDWATNRGGLDASVTAGVDYPTEGFAPLLPLPIEVPRDVRNFDSVEGVSLVKWRSGSEPRSMLYEARIALRQDRINVGIRFRSRLLSEGLSLDDIVARSLEIATFAVTTKLESA